MTPHSMLRARCAPGLRQPAGRLLDHRASRAGRAAAGIHLDRPGPTSGWQRWPPSAAPSKPATPNAKSVCYDEILRQQLPGRGHANSNASRWLEQRAIEIEASHYLRQAKVDERDRALAVSEAAFQKEEAELAANPPAVKAPPNTALPAARTTPSESRAARSQAPAGRMQRRSARAPQARAAQNVAAAEARRVESIERQKQVARRVAEREAKAAKRAADEAAKKAGQPPRSEQLGASAGLTSLTIAIVQLPPLPWERSAALLISISDAWRGVDLAVTAASSASVKKCHRPSEPSRKLSPATRPVWLPVVTNGSLRLLPSTLSSSLERRWLRAASSGSCRSRSGVRHRRRRWCASRTCRARSGTGASRPHGPRPPRRADVMTRPTKLACGSVLPAMRVHLDDQCAFR